MKAPVKTPCKEPTFSSNAGDLIGQESSEQFGLIKKNPMEYMEGKMYLIVMEKSVFFSRISEILGKSLCKFRKRQWSPLKWLMCPQSHRHRPAGHLNW